MLEVPLAVLLSVAAGAVPADDSIRALERTARASAHRYERVLWQSAPERLGSPRAEPCDERIGRFCFWYPPPGGPPPPPPPPDPPEVVDARAVAVREHRRWFSAAPAEWRAAGPLVRYLVESERSGEAVAAARTHVWAAGGTPASLLLLGMALHYAGAVVDAEAAFDSARAIVPAPERRRLDDVGSLLDPGERRLYDGLSPEARAAYEARFWAFANPSYLTAGNERRSGHYARHALGRILAEAPRAEGVLRWGSDHEEILVRFGTPTSRRRYRESSGLGPTQLVLVERFSPYNVALVPPALLTAGLPTLAPGEPSPLERRAARSQYASLRTPRLRGLELQASVFPAPGGAMIRADAMLEPDTADPRVPVRPAALLVVLDTLGRELARTPGTAVVRADSVTVFGAEIPVPPGAYVLRAEIADDSIGFAGMAQQRVDVSGDDGPGLSDLLIARPLRGGAPASRLDTLLQPLPSLVVPPESRLGVYAELTGLSAGGSAGFHIEAWLERAEERTLIGRAVRWAGERLGVVEPETPMRLRWAEGAADGAATLFFDLDLAGAPPGLYRLGLTVGEAVSAEERTSFRLIRIDRAAAGR